MTSSPTGEKRGACRLRKESVALCLALLVAPSFAAPASAVEKRKSAGDSAVSTAMAVVFPAEAANRGYLGPGTPLPDLSARATAELVRRLRAEERRLLAPPRPGRPRRGDDPRLLRQQVDLVETLVFSLSADPRRQRDPRPIVELLEAVFPASGQSASSRRARLRELPRFLAGARRTLIWPDPALCRETSPRLEALSARLAVRPGEDGRGFAVFEPFRRSIVEAGKAAAGVRLEPREWLAVLESRFGRPLAAPEVEALADTESASASSSLALSIRARYDETATTLENASLESLAEPNRTAARLRRIAGGAGRAESSDLSGATGEWLRTLSLLPEEVKPLEAPSLSDPIPSLLAPAHGEGAVVELSRLRNDLPGLRLLTAWRRTLPFAVESYRPFFGSAVDEAWRSFAVDLVFERSEFDRVAPELELARRHLRLLEALAARIDVRLGLSTAQPTVLRRWAEGEARRSGFLDDEGASRLVALVLADPGREALRLLARRELDRARGRSEGDGEELAVFLRRFVETPPGRPAGLEEALSAPPR